MVLSHILLHYWTIRELQIYLTGYIFKEVEYVSP